MKNIKNFIYIGSNNISKLLKEINQISTIKVTIYKESTKQTYIILPHLASGKSSGREIKITITDKEELGELLNGIGIVSRRKMEKDQEIVNVENNVNQKEVIILKSPPLCGKMFEFLTETQGLFSYENSNLCAAIQRNRFYASDGRIANSMHVLPISQFSRDVLVTGESSLFPKLTDRDQEGADLHPNLHKEMKDSTEDKDDHLHKKSQNKDLKLEKRISEFETCLSEIFYDTTNEEIILVEHSKMTKNSKSSPAVVEVHEFRSNDQPRVKKSRVLLVSESRFKKLENSFAKFQAKKNMKNLEPLLTEYDNKNEIMEKLEDKFVDKIRQMQNTYKKKNLIVMNFDLPGRWNDELLVDVNDSKFENSLMSSNISKTYIDSLKSSLDIAKKRKNRGNLVVVNDQIFKTSTSTINTQNKNSLEDDNKALVFLNNAIYKELEKKTMFSILNRKYSTGKNKDKKTRQSVSGTDQKLPKTNKKSSVELGGYSEIPLDNLIAAVAEKKRLEYAARSKIVLEVYEHYEKILKSTKILNLPGKNNWTNMDMKENSLSKVFKGGFANRVSNIDQTKERITREISNKEVKIDKNMNLNELECSEVFKGESASTRIVLPYENNNITPKGTSIKEVEANENIYNNEYDLSELFKEESDTRMSTIDQVFEKNEMVPRKVSTEETKTNENIDQNGDDHSKVIKNISATLPVAIDLPFEKNEMVTKKVSTKEAKVNKNIDQNKHVLPEVIKTKSVTKPPAKDLPYKKIQIAPRKVSTKEAKAVKNIDQNEHDLPKVIKTKSVTRPAIPYEKIKMASRKISSKEPRANKNIDQNKHDLPQVIKTKSVTRPAIDLPYEKIEMASRNISSKETKANKNIDQSEYDLPEVIKTKSVTRPAIDLPYEKIEMVSRKISSKEAEANENIDQSEHVLPEIIKTKSITRPPAIDLPYEKIEMTQRKVSPKEANSSGNIDQNKYDLPEVIKTKCITRPAAIDKNEMVPKKLCAKETKAIKIIDQNENDLPEVIKTKSVTRPPAMDLQYENKEILPRKVLTRELKESGNVDNSRHDISNVIRGKSTNEPPPTDLAYEKKEMTLKEISTKEVEAIEDIDQIKRVLPEVTKAKSVSKTPETDLPNDKNNITLRQVSTKEKRDNNIDQNDYDLQNTFKIECDNKSAQNEISKMTKGEIEKKEKGDEIVASKIDNQPPTLKAEVKHTNLPQTVVAVKSKIPLKMLSSPKTNVSIVETENKDIQQNHVQNDEKFIDSKLKVVQDEIASKESFKEMTSTTAKNIQKVTIGVKSSTIKSRLPRLAKPIKHTINKDKNETFLKIPKAEDNQTRNEEDFQVPNKKTGSSKEIEKFIDLKKIMKKNSLFADVHRLIFSEHVEEEMEVFNRKITPNKFQLQFLQNVLKRPVESQHAKSNVEDCEAVVKRMVTQIETEETAFHLKIAKREPGTFVIAESSKNEETYVGQNETPTSKSKISSDPEKKTSTNTNHPDGKEPFLQTQPLNHLDKFQLLELFKGIQEKKLTDQQYSPPSKNSIVSNQNEIDENNNIDFKVTEKSNILKKVEDAQGTKQVEVNAKTKEIEQSEEKIENASSKSISQTNCSESHTRGEEIPVGAVELADKTENNNEPKRITAKSENVAKNETVHLGQNFEGNKNPQTAVKEKVSTNTKDTITGLVGSDDIGKKIIIDNSKKNNEIYKCEKMHRIKVQGRTVSTKDKVRNDDKKKKQKEENIQLTNHKSVTESRNIPNELGPNSDVIEETNNMKENTESSVEGKQKLITDKTEKFSRNEEEIFQSHSEMQKSCDAEEKLKLITIMPENVIKKNVTTDEPLQKFEPTDSMSRETENEKSNVTSKEACEYLDGTQSKMVEIRDEKEKIKIENVPGNNEENISEVKGGSSVNKSEILAENSTSNIEKLKEKTESHYDEAQNEMIKRKQETKKGKNDAVFSSYVSNSELKKNSVVTENFTDGKQKLVPMEKFDKNIECRLTVVENGRHDVPERSSDGIEISSSCSPNKITFDDKEKLEEISKTSNPDETSGNIDKKKTENTDKMIEIAGKSKDVTASMKKTTNDEEFFVSKYQCHNVNVIPNDVLKKSASENVIIIKAAKKDSEETVESVLGITKPFLEQIQSKMINFVTTKTKSKAKIRNFSFRSHAVKKCKEITALLKKSQDKLFEDNSAGLANICQHAKMINRFSRTKLSPKRLNGTTPKTGNTFVTTITDKSNQPQDKKTKKKAAPHEELVKSAIESKVASKMKSLAKPPNDVKKLGTVKTVKSPQITTNRSDGKQCSKLDEKRDLITSSDSISDLGKDSIGSIFAEVVASALIKCGNVEHSVDPRSDPQDELANIMSMAQDIKQKIDQLEVTETEEDVKVIPDATQDMKKPDEFIMQGNDLRKLALNVKFHENRGRCSGDKYKCTVSLVLDEKAKDEDVKLLKSVDTSAVFRQQEEKTYTDSLAPLTNEVIEKSEEKQIKIPNEQILTMEDKTNTAVSFQVSPIHDVKMINDSNSDKTKINENNDGKELLKIDKLDVEVRNRMSPISEKTNRDEQKCILKVEDEIKRHAFEFIHTQSTNATPKLYFDKISKNDTQKDKTPRENLDNEVTIIKNNQEVIVTIPIEKKIPRDITEISGFLEELDVGIAKNNEKAGDGSTVPVPDHLMRLSKVQNDNLLRSSKLKSFVGKSGEVNAEIGKIVEFHGLNRQNRNSAMKYLSFSDEYTKTTLDVFPEVFFTPFSSNTNVVKEVDVVSEDGEENFGMLQNLSNLDQVRTGMTKVIHIATNESVNNKDKNLTYANDIRTSCRVNDFPNSKICRDKDKPTSRSSQNFEYLKRRIEQDRIKNHVKVGNSKDELKAKNKSEDITPNKTSCNESLKEAFAGLEKMGDSIKEKPTQRENTPEKSSVRKPIGDYLQNQRREFATKNPFIFDLTQGSTEKLFPKKSNVSTKAQFVQMKVEVPEDVKKETFNNSPEAGIPGSQTVSRKNSFYHEMVRRSEANRNKIEKEKEKYIVPENSRFCVFNAMKESFDEVCSTKKVYLGSRPSMKQYAQMIMADEIKSCNDLAQIRNEPFSNTNSNEENPKMDISGNKDHLLPASEICLYNLQTSKHNRSEKSNVGSIVISDENKINENTFTRGSILNTQEYFKMKEPETKNIKMLDVTSILEKKEKRPVDSMLEAVHYEPLVIEDLQIKVDEKSESHKEEELSFKPKISQIPIRTTEVIPKHNVLEKFAAIDKKPGSPVYKIRGDLTFDSSTKRIHKNVSATHEKQKPRPQVTNVKSKGVAVQENATKRPSSAKPKSKKMIVKLTPSKQLYSPPPKSNHDDLKRTLLKNPSKLLEIAGEIMDKNQYLNFLLDLKSRKEIRNIWWKKIYNGIVSSLKLADSFTSKAKRSEKSSIKVKSSFSPDVTKTKSKKAMKVDKKQSFNLEPLFIAPKKERKKEKIIGVKEKPAMPNLTKRLTVKSLRTTPNYEEKVKIISTETDTDNVRSKSANLKSPKGNLMLKSDTHQDSTNRRNLSSQHRESVNSKSNALPYTLKKFLETPDLTIKKSTIKNFENEKPVENFQNVFVLGEELRMPTWKYTVECLEMPNEFGIFNGIQNVQEEHTENQAQKNLNEVLSSLLLSQSTLLKDGVTKSMSEEECFNEILLQAEEDIKSSSDYKKASTSMRCDGSNEESSTEIEISQNVDKEQPMSSIPLDKTNNVVVRQSEKDLSFVTPENLVTDGSIGDCVDNNSVELSAQPSSEKSFLESNNNINEVKKSSLDMITPGNLHIHLDNEDIKVFAKETPKSIASSIRDSSDLDNYFDVLSFPISSTRSETEDCRVKTMETSEFDDSSDVFSNRSAPVSSGCSAAKEYKNAAKRAASMRSSKGEILQRNALFGDMRESNKNLMIGANPTGNMNFQTRRKFENPLSKFVPKKKTTHSSHMTNVQHSQESISKPHVENIPKVRVIRTKSFSEVLKDDPYFLLRLREQKKTPSNVTPRRVEEVPKKFEYRYHDFRRKYEARGEVPAKTQPRKKDFFEKFRDLLQTKRPFGEDNQRSQEEEAEQTRLKVEPRLMEKTKCVQDDKATDSATADNADGAATDRNTNTARNFCNSLLLKSKFGSWRFVHTKMEHIDEDELMTWVQEHPYTPMTKSKTDNSKGDENEKQNVIHVPWISSSAKAEEDN